ncbi:MAG TPA: HU family DNA-binding protein [Dyella sp.]|uniref:HU family DNA-binding protein n=1 Tax=Dyella sp. TaxID=1869338 RepID=UPI002F954862
MSKSGLIDHLVAATEIGTKKAASDLLDKLAEHIHKSLKGGDEVTLPGIGKLKVAQKPERTGRNPGTGEPMTIPARRVVKFVTAKALKDGVAEA